MKSLGTEGEEGAAAELSTYGLTSQEPICGVVPAVIIEQVVQPRHHLVPLDGEDLQLRERGLGVVYRQAGDGLVATVAHYHRQQTTVGKERDTLRLYAGMAKLSEEECNRSLLVVVVIGDKDRLPGQ